LSELRIFIGPAPACRVLLVSKEALPYAGLRKESSR
jgi:hypothetical protein